jgi:hypothetical protein
MGHFLTHNGTTTTGGESMWSDCGWFAGKPEACLPRCP